MTAGIGGPNTGSGGSTGANGGGGGGGGSSSSLVDIPTTAINAGIFSTLVAALSATDLVGALSSPNGPHTVFAPTDDAFASLPNGLVPCLLQEDNLPVLSNILLYHVASGEVLSTDLTEGMNIPTLLQRQSVIVDLSNGNGVVKINDSTVTTADVLATNGVIHIIDHVLVPPKFGVNDFLVLCREENPDLEPAAGGEMDKALTEDTASDGRDLGVATNEKDGTEGSAAEEEESSATSVISTLGSIVAAAVVTVFGM